MNFYKIFILIGLGLPLPLCLDAQEIFLDSIKGVVYEINNDMHGYVDHIEDFPVNDVIYPNDIHYPETKMIYGFDGIFPNDSFAIIFTGNLVITKEGLFELSLNSDDGTILWINDLMVIHNDGCHPMRRESEILYLLPGAYKFRLWYYQDRMDKMGLIFDRHFLGGPDDITEHFEFASDILFATSKYELTAEGQTAIDSIINLIPSLDDVTIVIGGHTDSFGSEQDNMILSEKRARAVRNYIESTLPDQSIRITHRAFGELVLKVEERTDADRQSNRRVEMIVYKK